MKIKLLKEIRLKVLSKYKIVNWSHVSGCKEKPWHIACGVHTCLAYHEYATKDEAIKALKLLWHEEAENYLWEHKLERKRNKYLW
jgi:hypothetical protein